ncbi:response regulator transcription factor [Chloroflexota bacterium]
MRQPRILVVDDEPRIVKFLQIKLKSVNYDVITASSGQEALDAVYAQEPDIIILDVVMPGLDGLETLKQIRTISGVPVIILSARGDNIDKVKGLNLGADDYITKPFSPDELVARIEAIQRRIKTDPNLKTFEELSIGDFYINFQDRTLTTNNQEKHLTRIEWLLMSVLVQNAGRLMLYSDLLTRIWGPEYKDDVQILRTWMSRLRNKIETDPKNPALIQTIPKTGYIFKTPTG